MIPRRSRGFTLMELVVVVAILAVAAAILFPRLPRLTGTERTAAIRRLALTLQADHEEAAIKKKALRSSTTFQRTLTLLKNGTMTGALT